MTRRVVVSLAGDFASLCVFSTSVVTGDKLLSVAGEQAPSPRRQSAPESLLAGYAVSNPWTSIPLGGGENTEHPVFFPTRHQVTSFPVFSSLCHSVYLRSFLFLFLSEQINDKSSKSDDESEDEDDPVKLQKKRDWDEWKDGLLTLELYY